MASEQNKYAGISTLQTFLSQLKNLFITKTDANAALSGKADASHNHDDDYYTEAEVDSLLSGKSDSTHNHDSKYDAKGSASFALEDSKTYTDNAVAQKSQVQIITWGADD